MKKPQALFMPGAKYARYAEMIEPGIPQSALTAPDFWVHVRHKLRMHDVIECVALDGAYEVDLRVIAFRDTYPVFRVIRQVQGEVGSSPPKRSTRYSVKHIGRGQYAVIENSTGRRMAEGGLNEADANAELERLDSERVAA